VEAFAEVMNRRARELGAVHSHFVNPNGLPVPGQYSSARDLSIIARAAYANSTIRSIVCLPQLVFRYANGRTRELENTNKVLKRLPYCNGMKTGYTEAAGHCLISSGSRGGRDIIGAFHEQRSQEIDPLISVARFYIQLHRLGHRIDLLDRNGPIQKAALGYNQSRKQLLRARRGPRLVRVFFVQGLTGVRVHHNHRSCAGLWYPVRRVLYRRWGRFSFFFFAFAGARRARAGVDFVASSFATGCAFRTGPGMTPVGRTVSPTLS
jgi:hypothetical protein